MSKSDTPQELTVTNSEMQSQELQVAQDPMLSFIERASKDPHFDSAKLRELLEMRREIKLEAAKEDFEQSFADFKRNVPVIQKTKGIVISKGADAKPAYYYAPLDEVCEKLIPALIAVGITHKWRTTYEGDYMVVTCLLKKGLHTDDGTSMRGLADTSGSKNPIMAEGSTLSYLERYTLCAACGIAVKGADTDAQGMSTGDVSEQVEFIENSCSLDELERMYKQAANKALDAADRKAILIFKAAKAKKEKEF